MKQSPPTSWPEGDIFLKKFKKILKKCLTFLWYWCILIADKGNGKSQKTRKGKSMKKYVATIEGLDNEARFEIYEECGILFTESGEEIYDMQNETPSEKEIVETVYALYNTNSWDIADCIEYED